MAATEICYRCMEQSMHGGQCVRCGMPLQAKVSPPGALPLGTVLVGRFMTGVALGSGGFGITYIALDHETRERVAIKEYYPTSLCRRDHDGVQVSPISADAAVEYERSLRSFQKEACTLYELREHPNIVKVRGRFETNGTAYFVMELLKGQDMRQFLRKGEGKLSMAGLYPRIAPVLGALAYAHSMGVYHRDLSPDNLYLCDDGNIKLIDFGAAHVDILEFTRSYPGVRKAGYTPLEQNLSSDKEGPWTDVYAIAATMYFLLTGEAPPNCYDRLGERDCIVPPSGKGANITPQAEKVLLKALALKYQDRYRTINAFARELHAAMQSTALRQPLRPAVMAPEQQTSSPEPLPQQQRKDQFAQEAHRDSGRAALPGTRPVKTFGLSQMARYGLGYLAELGLFYGLPSLLWGPWGMLVGYGAMCLVNLVMILGDPGATIGQWLFGLRLNTGDGLPPRVASVLPYALLYGLPPLMMAEAIFAWRKRETVLWHETLLGLGIGLLPHTARTPRSTVPVLTLVCHGGPMAGTSLHYPDRAMLLGRDPRRANTLLHGEDKRVSGLHCEIMALGDAYAVIDRESTNGTYLNGARLPANKPMPLRNGDHLSIGLEQFTISLT